MVAENDAAYKYVQQANAKEALRKLPSGYEERKRTRTSQGVLRDLCWRWVFWIGIFCLNKHRGDWLLLICPIGAIIETAYHYPEWSRKREAEKSQ